MPTFTKIIGFPEMFALLKSVMIATLVVTLYYSFTLLPAFFILFVMWSDRRDGVDTDALIAAGTLVAVSVILTIPLGRRRPISRRSWSLDALVHILTSCSLTVLLHDAVKARHRNFSSPALLLPGFQAAVTAANDTSGYYNRQGRRGVYDALVDIGERAHENEQTLLGLFPRLQGSIDWCVLVLLSSASKLT